MPLGREMSMTVKNARCIPLPSKQRVSSGAHHFSSDSLNIFGRTNEQGGSRVEDSVVGARHRVPIHRDTAHFDLPVALLADGHVAYNRMVLEAIRVLGGEREICW